MVLVLGTTTFILTYFPAIIYINTPQSLRRGVPETNYSPKAKVEHVQEHVCVFVCCFETG